MTPAGLRGTTRYLGAGAATAALILAIRNVVDPPGPWLLIVLGLVVLASPISRSYSRRLFLGGVIVVGWLPLLWWVPLPIGTDRSGLAVAIAAGAFVAFVVRSGGLVSAHVVTRPRVTDAIPVAAVSVVVWLYFPLVEAREPRRALAQLVTSGWDHVAHFFMSHLVDGRGSIPATVGPSPDGSGWTGSSYPKHFHALVDAFSGLLSPASEAGSLTPAAYGTATVVLLAVAVGILGAGIAQLPPLRRHPFVTFPLAAFALVGFVFGPGSEAISTGYPNFVIGCAAAASAVLITASMPRATTPIQAIALAGLVGATAHLWLLLLPLTATAAVIAVLPFRGRWRGSRGSRWMTLGAMVAAAIGVVAAVVIASSELTSGTALLGNAASYHEPLLAGLLLACAGIVALMIVRKRRAASIALVAVPAIGALVLFGFGAYQFAVSGGFHYYFIKLSSGTLLVVTMAAVALAATVIPAQTRALRTRGLLLRGVGTVALTTAALQLYDYVQPTASGETVFISPALYYREEMVALDEDSLLAADRLTDAAQLTVADPFGSSTAYLALLPGDPTPHLANQWYLSLSGGWSEKSNDFSVLIARISKVRPAAGVEALLDRFPQLTIIVAPSVRGALVGELPPEDAPRLRTWQ